MGHIFISYSHTDTAYAYQLAKALQKRGFETWIDERLDYGSQWPLEIQKQLDTCAAFVLVMSPRAFSSEWVQSELSRAKRKQKPIFPLLLEGDEPWLTVESTQFIDVRGGELPPEKFYPCLEEVLSARKTTATPNPQAAVQPQLKPTQPKRTLKILGISSVFLICAALLGISFLTLPKIFSHEPTRVPASTPTSKPANTLTSEPANINPPLVATVNEARAMLADKRPFLDEKGYISKLSTDKFKPGTTEWIVSLRPSDKVIWSHIWCAGNDQVLESNLKAIKLQFILNREEISDLAQMYYPSEELSCRIVFTALHDWPAGTHHLTVKALFTTIVNDGADDYEPGEYLTNYTVNVKP